MDKLTDLRWSLRKMVENLIETKYIPDLIEEEEDD